MNTNEVIAEIKKAGNESTKKTLMRHGAKEPFYGVKIEDLKKIQKKIKENQQQVAMELFDSGIGDAMYLAGLMANGAGMTKKQLWAWAAKGDWPMISEYTVPWVTAENKEAWDIAMQWIDSPKPNIACSGWSTLAGVLALRPDENLNLSSIKKLLRRIEKEINKAPNRVKYCMNGFVIAVGSYVKPLNKDAIETGKKIGEVEVDMNGTSCKAPFAPGYIKKVMDKGNLGRKKKTLKC
jgi:3-methyladenine DNA glycosylase AlkD